MSSGKYSRLPSHIPPRRYKFPALEGPGYFTYDAQPGKYSSMFSYSRTPSTEYSSPSDTSSSTSLTSADAAQPLLEQVTLYGDQSCAGAYVAGWCVLWVWVNDASAYRRSLSDRWRRSTFSSYCV